MKMVKKIVVSSFIVFSFLSPVFAQTYNAGFVTGMWLSKRPIFVGDTIRIYTAVRNHSGFDINGSVVFVVDGEEIDAMGISGMNEGTVEVWTDYVFDYGDHSIEARITDPATGEDSSISLEEDYLNSRIFVDRDTDGDQIGDAEDEDDDGDGISDEDELAAGTDPLTPNTDPEDTSTGSNQVQDAVTGVTEFIQENVAPAIGSAVEGVDQDNALTEQAIAVIEREKQNLFDIALERGTGLSPSERLRIFLLDIGAFLVSNWLWVIVAIAAIILLKKLANRR